MSSAALLARRLHGSAASAIPAKPAHAMPASRAALPGYLQARLRQTVAAARPLTPPVEPLVPPVRQSSSPA